MTPAELVEQKIEEQAQWLNELICEYVEKFANETECIRDPQEVFQYCERLKRWRREKLDQLRAKLLAEINRLN